MKINELSTTLHSFFFKYSLAEYEWELPNEFFQTLFFFYVLNIQNDILVSFWSSKLPEKLLLLGQ